MIRILRFFSIRFRLLALMVFLTIFFVFFNLFIYQFTQRVILTQVIDSLFDQSQHLTSGLAFILAGMVVSFLFTLLYIAWVSRSIVIPLKKYNAAIASLQLNDRLPSLDGGANDEISNLGKSLNPLLENIINVKSDMENKMSQQSDALAQRASHLQAAVELAQICGSILDVDDLLVRAVNFIKERFGLYFVAVYLLDLDREFVSIHAGTGDAGNLFIAEKHRIKVGENGFIGAVTASGKARIINDVGKDFIYQKDPLLGNTRAQAVFPLKHGTEVVGVLDVHSEREGFFEPEIISILQILVDQLTLAVRNNKLVSDLQAIENEAKIVNQRSTQDIWPSLALIDIPKGYQKDILGISSSSVTLPSDLLETLRSGQPVVNSLPDEKNKTVLLAPLMVYDQLIGFVGLEDSYPDRQWTEEEMKVLQAISNQVSQELNKSSLIEGKKLRSDHLDLSSELNTVTLANLNFRDMLISVVDLLSRKLGASWCDVFWLSHDKKLIRIHENKSDDRAENIREKLHYGLPLAENPFFTLALDSKKTVTLSDTQLTSLANEGQVFFGGLKLSSLLITPLFLRGEVNGVLLLGKTAVDGQFNLDDNQMMDQVSKQIDAALDVAMRLEEAKIRIDQAYLIAEMGARMQENRDIDAVLRVAVQNIRQALNLQEVSIVLSGEYLEPDGDVI
jgi:GAF domain-containing protein